jgi:hypothetical protein
LSSTIGGSGGGSGVFSALFGAARQVAGRATHTQAARLHCKITRFFISFIPLAAGSRDNAGGLAKDSTSFKR